MKEKESYIEYIEQLLPSLKLDDIVFISQIVEKMA